MWAELTALAASKKPITYESLAEKLGVHHRVLRYPLDLIFKHCSEVNLPPLTVLVVNKTTGLPGVGYTTDGSVSRDRQDVFAHPWSQVENPFGFAGTGATHTDLVQKVLSSPQAAREVHALVKTRGVMQRIFKDALLDAYRSRCAFSGSAIVETLEAAHIVPWAEASEVERYDVRNGLLLNSYFHRLFDRGLLLLSPECRIQPSPDLELKNLNPFDRQAIEPILNQPIKWPRNKAFFPGRAYLARRTRF